ncbi:MAG: DUF1592 domain-containing protein [Alphaproteobacteria bacterium]|nr:DUF1592 domain-containing protein [Alphaproteobacteria bacterium]
MVIASLLTLLACAEPTPTPVDSVAAPEQPEAAPAAPQLRRLTVAQYHNALTDLFGEGLILPTRLEPDQQIDGLVAVGNAVTSVSSRGVEQYEDAAFNVADQVVEDATRFEALWPCAADAEELAPCYAELAETLGAQAWRRPLSAEEEGRLVDLALHAAETLGSAEEGTRFLLAAMLQSPNFLYRVELGAPDAEHPGLRRLTEHELAARLSFTLWNAPPDAALRALAEAGTLSDPAVLEAEAQRMLDDPRATAGLRSFFTDMLELDAVEDISKDPFVFPHYTEALGAAAAEETLLGLERIFTEDLDYREFLTTRTAFIDRQLASIYGLPAPAREGHGEATLPEDGPRAGFFGQVSFLALQAHAVSTSATLRGKYVREVMLCQPMVPPPADVDASIPEPSPDAPTLRDRLAVHLEAESCAGCHRLMDPIGLGFEQFDGVGAFRVSENEVRIDPSGELDGQGFSDALGLARAVTTHENLAPCLTETWYRWTLGHDVAEEEEAMVDFMAWQFQDRGWSLRELMLQTILNPHFLYVGEVEG